MSTRLATVWLLAAALLMAGLQPTSVAKPPGPPVAQKVMCEPQAQPKTKATLGRGAGVDSDAELTGELVLVEEPEGCGCALAGEVIKKCWQFMVDCFAARSAEPPQPRDTVSPLNPSCPFLQQQAAARKPATSEAGISATSVIENLRKLEAAQRLYQAAEYYRQIGRLNAARECYQAVQTLCPGSRYDRAATARLQEAQTPRAIDGSDANAEEQELTPVDKSKPAGQPRPKSSRRPAPKPDLLRCLLIDDFAQSP